MRVCACPVLELLGAYPVVGVHIFGWVARARYHQTKDLKMLTFPDKVRGPTG